MKTLHLVIITLGIIAASMVVFVLNSYLNTHPPLTLQNNESYNNTSSANLRNYDATNVSTIIIPKGSSDPSSEKNYEPRYLIVVLGVNNTVRWINEDDAPDTIVSDTYNQPDPLFEKGPYSKKAIMSGKSFNFTFTKIGEYQYDTEPHPWLYGWVLVLPQSPKDAIQTVTLNASSGVPDPCETFRMPCPFHSDNYNFTAQRFGSDIYIEKVTANGVDNYAIIKPNKTCYYPPSYSNSCTNPDDLVILRLVGVDTSIPQENVHVTITGLAPSYLVGEPIDFGITIKGFGHCDIPSVLVTHQGYIDWQSKTSWPSDTTPCETGMHDINMKYDIGYLGGPIYLNQSGTYTVHVGYASNMTEKRFDVMPSQKTSIFDNGIYPFSIHVTNSNFTINYNISENNKLLDANMDSQSKSLILTLESTDNGTLIISIPRALLDIKKNDRGMGEFYMLADGQETTFKEIHTTPTDRIFSIPFQNGTKSIEIIATELI